MAISRTLGTFLVLLNSVLLLSIRPIQQNGHHRREQVVRPQSFQDVEFALNITSDGTRTVARLFGQQDQKLKLTSQHHLFERALAYQYAVCKGGDLWDMVQEAFDGRRPAGHNFGPNDLANGWTETPITGGLGGLPPGWDAAFATFPTMSGKAPTAAEIHNLYTVQDKPFRNSQGDQIQNPTGASYQQYYVPSHNAMLAKYVESPTYRLTSKHVPAQNIPNLIPPLHRLSDLSWYTYSKLASNPGRLRYIGHHFISNDDTKAIFDRILQTAYKTNTPNVAWPGFLASVNSDEGKALLATPNGVGVAWLMIERAAALGRRRPVVRIWNANGFRCMLWDLVPVSA
ncbi:MAG: hypothetical protein L6R38_004864 [Xanthoria sp. 2 TBL-2021]|nr:MAG: hypothetical protein L6R38_004864 [Xanthoria sp. 2 TBL-2021]